MRCCPRILGIDPGPTVSALHERILRQEPPDTKQAAKTTARSAMATAHTVSARTSVVAALRDTAGRHYPIQAAATPDRAPSRQRYRVER